MSTPEPATRTNINPGTQAYIDLLTETCALPTFKERMFCYLDDKSFSALLQTYVKGFFWWE